VIARSHANSQFPTDTYNHDGFFSVFSSTMNTDAGHREKVRIHSSNCLDEGLSPGASSPGAKYRINRKKSSIYRLLLYILFFIFFKSESILENIRFFKVSRGSTTFLIKKNIFSIGKSVIMRIYLRGSDDKYIINIILSFYSSARRIYK
jgi:hypothetical protein